MYVIIDTITKNVEVTKNLSLISEVYNIPLNKLQNNFSRKKLTYFEYLNYQVYKRELLVNERTK